MANSPLSPSKPGRLVPILAVLSIMVVQAAAQGPNRAASTLHGEAAISALAGRLPEVARAHGLDAAALAIRLRAQRGLGVDADGALLFVCAAPTALPAAALPGSTAESTVTSASGDPLRLHSFPGAQRVIYLDFTGHTTTGTQWNSKYNGGAPIVSQPFDLDGNPGSFNAAEQSIIRGVWQRVAEDYAPFLVDVTTEDPGIEALRRTSSGDANYGIRVVISQTNWYSGSAGGVAYIDSFNWNSDAPCFVFAAQLSNGEKYIAESAAHEVGHTLGLYHDGTVGGTEYYSGHGNWAPIMGVGYYKPITTFSRGEYQNASNTEDDLARIASFIAVAADDHGNTPGSASLLAGPNVSDGGTIERSNDVDVFRFNTGGGSISLNLEGPSPQPNLDIQAELLDSNGTILQVSNPAGLSANITANVAAGTYYVRVSGVGTGNPASTGYSAYGSLGNYVITGSIGSGTSTPPTITVPGPITVQATSASGAVVTFSTSAQDSAGNYIATSNSPASGSTFPIGTTTVTTTATDSAGNTATRTFTVTVNTVATAKAQLTSPGGGTTLSTSSVTFAWTAGTGVSRYWLSIGSSAGATDIYDADQNTSLSRQVTGLPIDGQTIHTRLWSQINGAWQYNDYTNSTAANTARAELTSPVNGSTLGASSATFTWNSGSGVTRYWLSIGSSQGGTDLYDADQNTGLSRVVTGLPIDGRTIYTRLWSQINGSWVYHDYYNPTTVSAKAQLTSPANGTTLGSSSVTFAWSAGSGVTRYWLSIGSSMGGTDLYDSDQNTSLSRFVSGLPTDGRAVYTRLWSQINGSWIYNDYINVAASGSAKAELTYPTNGTTLGSSSATFTWSPGTGPTRYWLSIGSSLGGTDIYDADQDTSLSRFVSGLPTDGRTVYTRIWSLINGSWVYYDYYSFARSN